MEPRLALEMRGTLDLWSFRRYCEQHFSSAPPKREGSVSVGWQRNKIGKDTVLEWDSLEHATAEGLTVTAMAVAAAGATLISSGLPDGLNDAITKPLTAVALAVGAKFHEYAPGVTLLGPHKIQLLSADDCEVNARIFSDIFASLDTRDSNDPLRESIELTLLEVLTNAYEHGGNGYALLSAAIGRAERWNVSHMVESERLWLQTNKTSRILEIAVADVGPGVPAHLETSYIAAVAPLLRAQRSLSPRRVAEERWRAHTSICQWSFAHHSTSKVDNARPSDSLNWRGLHRALGYVSWHDGFIAISSGYARTGHATFSDKNHEFVCGQVAPSPLPGTLVTIRHSLRPTARHGRGNSGTGARSSALSARSVVAVTTSDPSTIHFQSNDGEAIALSTPVLHPFEQGWLHSGRRATDLENVRRATPGLVAMHYFTDVTADRLAGLTAESEGNEWSRAIGSPRLIGAWTPRAGILWNIAGAVPRSSLKWFTTLTRDATNHLPGDLTILATIRELARQYPEYVKVESDKVSLHHPDRPTAADIGRYASTALQHYPNLSAAIYDAPPNECVLLTDNTRVRRYFSLTALADGNDIIRSVLGFLMAHHIDRLRDQYGDFSLVTSTLASYYLARQLLRVADRHDVDVHLLGSRAARRQACVLFQTATRTGRSLADATLRAGGQTLAAIVGVDLQSSHTGFTRESPATRPLITFSFDPNEISRAPTEPYDPSARVICTVTDWPVRTETPPTLLLSNYAAAVAKATSELFSVGLQVIDARVHSVALPGARLVSEVPELIASWCAERIAAQLRPKTLDHVVIICRRESAMFELLPRVADLIYATYGSDISVERVTLPSVQFGGHSAIFGNVHSRTPIREDLRPQGTLISKVGLSSPYSAVYVDTAAVTGKNIRACISMLPSLESMPESLLVLVLTDRLSPREARFLTSIQLKNHLVPTAAIDLRLESMFRLQVGSHEHLDTAPAGRLMRELDEPDVRNNPITRPYLDKLRPRFDEVAHALAASSSTSRAFGHIYTPDDDLSLSPSQNAILFRHTLALYHQNEPVLTTLRTLLLHLVETYDHGLLSLLAIEPNLLRQPPLLLDGWADVRALAKKCLEDESAPLSAMSDAIVVATDDTATCLTEFRALATAVTRRPELKPQFFTFIARLLRTDEHAGEQFLRAIDELAEPARQLEHDLAPFVRARMQAFWPGTVRLDTDAVGTIHDFLKFMFPHSPAHNAWRDTDLFFDFAPESFAKGFPDALPLATVLALRGIIPTVAAVRRHARDRDDLTTANALESAQIVATETVDALTRATTDRDPPIADMIGATAKEAWTRLRDNLVVTDPHAFLGSVRRHGTRQGALERALRRYYCLPERLIADYLTLWPLREDPLVVPPLPPNYRPLIAREGGSWLAPVSCEAIQEIAVIVTQNHLKHGVAGTFRIGVRPVDLPGGTELHFIFMDVAGPRIYSSGLGLQVLARTCAHWNLPKPDHATTNGIFSLVVRLRSCAYLSWNQEMSREILHY